MIITQPDALLGAAAAVAVAGVPSLEARIKAMRADGMSELAIRRALGLSETEAIDCGLAAPAGWNCVRAERAVDARHTRLSMMEVVEAVARASGLDRKDLLGRRRTRPLARARHLAMYLVRELCPGASLPAIGYLLDRDHTTVLYGCRQAAALLERDAAFRRLREQARRDLDGAGADATVTVARVPAVAQAREILPAPINATALKALATFKQLNPVRQDIVLGTMRVLLEVQRGNESRGLMTSDDAALYYGRAEP